MPFDINTFLFVRESAFVSIFDKLGVLDFRGVGANTFFTVIFCVEDPSLKADYFLLS